MKPVDFLAELYAFDPDLREHEAELIPIIERLLASDPAVEPDPAFVAALRGRLRQRADELSTASPSFFASMKQFFTIAIPAAAIAVLIPAVVIFQNRTGLPAPTRTSDGEIVAQNAGKNAFGPLSDVDPYSPTMSRDQSGGGGPSAALGTGMGGDGGKPVNAVAPAPAMQEEGAAYDMAVSEPAMGKMIAPYPMIRYNYVFEGELAGLTDSVDVFKRTPQATSLPMSAIQSNINVSGIDIASFPGLRADYLTFVENKPFGYQISINLRDSTVSMDAQWDQWPMSKCTTEACYQAERVSINDIPADALLIDIATKFAADHGIDVSKHGAAEVDHQWKRDYERMADKRHAYIPETIRVVFPHLIDGKPVHDQSGGKAGISISVSVKHKRVMSAYGIMSNSYAKSAYTGVTDPAAIKTFLSKVDNYFGPAIDMMPAPEAGETKTVTVRLGAPAVGYATYFRYADNKNEELLIPSLIFPVTSADGATPEMYYRQTVVVPLAKDMLDEQNNQVYPMGREGVMY